MRNKTTHRANGEQYVAGSPAWILMLGLAPYDDGGRQPCGCSPEFHAARCPR